MRARITPFTPRSQPTTSVDLATVVRRIGVRPPYFALHDLTRDGLVLGATTRAEAPPFLERGPMTAAEVGRHAAIAGLVHAAVEQRDDVRRYYLARQASCHYQPNDAPYGTPVRLRSELLDVDRRSVHVRVEALTIAGPLAQIELRYAILTEPAFERLFRHRAQPTPPATSPYGQLLEERYERAGDRAIQTIDAIPVGACPGHFDGFPAMPVAVLMGQLSYLAGQLHDDDAGRPRPFRVVRGEIEADDLAWAGEPARFEVARAGADADGRRYDCRVAAADRPVGAMTLWLKDAG